MSGSPLLVITGLSGAGRSEAAKVLEDVGWYVVDNLPPALIPRLAELTARPDGPRRLAVVADVRSGVFFGDLSQALDDLRAAGVGYRILFLDAADEDLVNRYASTRHRHPLAPEDHVAEGIRAERRLMTPLRGEADLVIDTSGLSPHGLRERVLAVLGTDEAPARLTVTVISFGFKYGAPRDADVVLDCRFLPNPHWVPDLRGRPGTDPAVGAFVREQAAYRGFLDGIAGLLDAMLPGLESEGKSYLTVALGCTGGRHRSVVAAEDVAAVLRARGLAATVEHRDVDR
ncbi:MAG: RNase adapter RapZ [Actinomycetota bacterium]